MQTGLLVVERDPSLVNILREGRIARGPAWCPPISDTPLSLLMRYHGVDGNSWPNDFESFGISLINGLAPLTEMEGCQRYWQSVSSNHDARLLALGAPSDLAGINAVFRGFDVGWVSEDCGSFSAILHECLLGEHEALREFGPALNQDLLFSDIETAMKFVDARNRLMNSGADLETYGSASAIGVSTPEA